MTAFSSVLVGNETLALECGQILLDRGHAIGAVVTRNPDVRAWAEGAGLRVLDPGADLAERLAGVAIDWLFSIANLDLLPRAVTGLARKGAVNFHDGPLPGYAGLNTPVWAILNGAARHGVTWHLIAGGVDEGDILERRDFDIADDETALTLNARCLAAGLDSFAAVLSQLESGALTPEAQDLAQRRLFRRSDKPAAGGRIAFGAPLAEALRLIRALDHGDYRNPVTCPKIEAGGRVLIVGHAEPAPGAGAPGEVLAVSGGAITVALADGAISLSHLRDTAGNPVDPDGVIDVGQVLPSPGPDLSARIEAALSAAARSEDRWHARLGAMIPAPRPFPATRAEGELAHPVALPGCLTADHARACLGLLAAESAGGGAVDLALGTGDPFPGYLSPWVPVRFAPGPDLDATAQALAAAMQGARDLGPFAADLPARSPGLTGLTAPALGLSDTAAPVPGVALSLCGTGAELTLRGDPAQMSAAQFALFAARLDHVLSQASPDSAPGTLDLLPPAERRAVLSDWNATEAPFDAEICIHRLFEAQVARSPEAQALVFEGAGLTYAELDARANRVAQVLAGMGVKPGTLVGLHIRRSAEMLIGALAVLKAGGAYVPLDPGYPADRIALYLEDSGAQVILTEAALVPALPRHSVQVLEIDTDPRIAKAPDTTPDSGVTGADLAYLIYTSGSTGRPKGVMIEHRNVASFFTGMDARIEHDGGGVWLAVTSPSFDISVLELFWTLARGFAVVISGEESRTLVSDGRIAMTGRGMDFSLFYWGNDDGAGRDKYRMLLDGAEFADKHGFCAVWTPERHFHAFGGPYPNPAVTGAAVAAVTRNLAVRAGSCVAPLHHPARIAEDWAVIDNLTNGRAGLGIASGWQPHDFVLRPENTPPENKPAMYDAIDKLRALWRGEEVEFPLADGTPHKVLTQPRPVSKELPIWVTTAGNPDTWREAGEIGANVLTHLLGQSIDEVGDKIGIYHKALRDAGRDPADFTVTLMLHTYVAQDREAARETARGPMKDYLRSAAGLIKQFAWVFPAFKKPKGVDNPIQLDLGILSEDELDAILEFAFQRYFEESGLFGTIEDCLDRVEQLKRIGVDEIACLIDFGIARDKVLAGLRPLAEVLRRSNMTDTLAKDDFSIAAQILRHGVTHLQCTPSMARMIAGNDEARAALSRLKHLMIGGEALPGALVADLQSATPARIQNMYGPTETTIWSTTGPARAGEGVNGIGTPIANTRAYVLTDALEPVPVGATGELFIGGEGVARGYWQRPDLTDQRFLTDPFHPGGRIYRTGDLARWRADGSLDFLGRSDHQIKLRGYRIELGEIETALDGFAGVTQSVVLAREDVPGLVQLVGYLTAETPVDEDALRARLAAMLPEHMVPARFVTLDRFPLTPNRKIDRAALPAPGARVVGSVGVASANGGEAGRIAEIWARILGVTGIGPRDSFFDLGGHSLLAVQAHREIREALSVPGLSITDIFRFPVLAALAERVEALLGDDGAPAPAPPAPLPAANRADAMSRRRALRARRTGQG